jgi:hypothetical protein
MFNCGNVAVEHLIRGPLGYAASRFVFNMTSSVNGGNNSNEQRYVRNVRPAFTGQPLTEPMKRARISARWETANNSTTGRLMMTIAAARCGQAVLFEL